MRKLALITALTLLSPAPAFAQITFVEVPATASSTDPNHLKSDDDKVICRRQDNLGSRIRTNKLCLTKAQWWQYEHEEKEWVQHIQELASIGHSG
ncbi:MAG: hypothetical protein ACM3ZV_03385 [Bacillota bacterium]